MSVAVLATKVEAMETRQPQPPSMGYERYDIARWIRMFETMCARYRCRPIESVNPFADEDLWLSGPDGVWLTEVTSVEFDETGALTVGSLRALRALGRAVFAFHSVAEFSQRFFHRGCCDDDDDDSNDDEEAEKCDIAVDWFLTSTIDRHGQRRQCLVRVCRNARVVYVQLLANNVRNATMPPTSLSFSRYNDRLRPFVFIFVCQLLYERMDFECLNLHYEPLASSTTWRESQIAWWQSVVVGDAFSENRVTNGSGNGWLELARETHGRARWIRLLSDEHTNGASSSSLRAVVTRRSKHGTIEYLWRRSNRFSKRANSSECSAERDGYGVHPVARGTLLCLRDLDLEISKSRSNVLALCDFDVLYENTRRYLLFDRNNSHDFDVSTTRRLYRSVSRSPETTAVENDSVDANRERRKRGSTTTPTLESIRERRYFVDATGTLRSSLRTVFS